MLRYVCRPAAIRLNSPWLLATLLQGTQIEARYDAVRAQWGLRLAGVDVCTRLHCEIAYGFVFVDGGV